MSGPRSALAGVAAWAVLAGGCATTVSVPANGTLRIALTEYRLVPQSVRTSAGTLTIYVHNYGRLSHDLVISQGGVADASTKPIPPGGGTELFATLGPGHYLLASTISDDQALGEYGTLTVVQR